MEHFNVNFDEIKFASGGAKEGTFSGYASVFGNIDSHGDIVEKGAFKNTLLEWEKRGKWPKMLLQHGGFFGPVDDMLPIGKYTNMEENSKGLKVEGELFALSTDRGALIYEGMKSGELDGLSIGYKTVKHRMGTKPQDPARWLEEVKLFEVSIVTFGSNDKATIGQVKAADLLNPRELERELKSLLSATDAVKAVAIVKKHLQREAEGHPSTNARDEAMAMELLDSLKKLRAA